jgi:hypothetical protein
MCCICLFSYVVKFSFDFMADFLLHIFYVSFHTHCTSLSMVIICLFPYAFYVSLHVNVTSLFMYIVRLFSYTFYISLLTKCTALYIQVSGLFSYILYVSFRIHCLTLFVCITRFFPYMLKVSCRTGWRRPIGCLKLQVIFRKRATNYRALLRKMTYTDKRRMTCKDKASYTSLPPSTFTM